MKNYLVLAIVALSMAMLTACEKTKEQFDFSKKAPDEFQVTTRAPLEMPPEFSLRPPRPGAPRPQEDSAKEEAKQAVFGERAVQTSETQSELSQGEAILLQKSGVNAIDPNIRDKVDAESAKLAEESKSTVDRILGKAGRKTDVKAEVVNPVKEAERIKQNKESGAPITEGETPTTTR
jgi:hypothetical protein